MKIKTQREHGLSLFEIIFVIAVIALLLSLFVTHSGAKAKAKRIACVGNLKHVGLAAMLWSIEHENEFPWFSTNAAGSLAFANSPDVFRHYAVMSNELATPKVLVCATDRQRFKATDFSKFSNVNLSYFIALDADGSKPLRLLSGDRNITGGAVSNGFLRLLTPTNEAGWSTEMHKNAGNVGLADGSVQQFTELRLRKQLEDSGLPLIRLAIP